jgi:hypothetical protein
MVRGIAMSMSTRSMSTSMVTGTSTMEMSTMRKWLR